MVDNSLKNRLKEERNGRVRFDEPMSKHTSLRVGGPADVYAEPETPEEMIRLIRECGQSGINCTVIGGGTNLLVKDRGIRGLVISMMKFGSGVCPSSEAVLSVSAGMKLGSLCRYCIDRGLEGMNFAVGIPGTVGGAVMMNAGTASGSMQDTVESLDVLLSDGAIRRVQRTQLHFAYRSLTTPLLMRRQNLSDFVALLAVRFCLRQGDPEKLKKEAQNMMEIRRKKQPVTVPSAGCFFKNPQGAYNKHSAGELIERAGLKGKQIGGAQISEKHANFIINRRSATAADILTLAEIVRETVSEKFGIILETEVKIIGE
ncbi:MAG: UDP-N-acetylenolpyruvoylglucosamine reductase [Desulfobacteraceae bacterium IS3]|nr:MAG: UDP-N-acetylenolpyruvoylglucosamine reductase [Desulfobacteraceae bacterium IS3]